MRAIFIPPDRILILTVRGIILAVLQRQEEVQAAVIMMQGAGIDPHLDTTTMSRRREREMILTSPGSFHLIPNEIEASRETITTPARTEEEVEMTMLECMIILEIKVTTLAEQKHLHHCHLTTSADRMTCGAASMVLVLASAARVKAHVL